MARRTTKRKKFEKSDDALDDEICHTMKKRHHMGNKNIMMSPTLAAKERSGPSLTSGLSDQPGKGVEGDIMAKASTGGRKGPRHQIQEANQKIWGPKKETKAQLLTNSNLPDRLPHSSSWKLWTMRVLFFLV